MVLHILRSKKFARKILLLLLVIIIPAFVLWGAGSVTNRPKPVGKIGTESISYEEFTESRQGMKVQVLFTYYGDFNTMTQIMKNRPMLNLMAWERLILLTSAKDAKMSIPDKEVLSFIAQHPLFQRTGKFDKEVYQYILTNTLSVTPRQFEELVRENMEIQALRQQLIGNLTISEKELKEHYKKLNDKVRFSYFLIGGGRFVKDVTVTDADAKKYYDENQKYFEQSEQVKASHILIKVEPTAEDSEKTTAREKIQEIKQKLEAGGDFAELAKKSSEGPSGPNGGDLGYFGRGQMVPSFEETAFALEVGHVSEPVETQFGYHLIKVFDKKSGSTTPFEEVKERIEQFLKGQKMNEAVGLYIGTLKEKAEVESFLP